MPELHPIGPLGGPPDSGASAAHASRSPAEDHPSRDRSHRFSGDALLRMYGYRIHARPRRGPVLWRRAKDGELFTQAEALRTVRVGRVDECTGR